MTDDERKELHWLRDMHAAIGKIHSHPRFSEGRSRCQEIKAKKRKKQGERSLLLLDAAQSLSLRRGGGQGSG